jgi:rRNA maturation RNase YbeY
MRVEPSWLKHLIAAALDDPALRRGVERVEYELGVLVVGAAAIARLNERHLGHAGPTDVITFDYRPPERARAHDGCLRGEIVVCPEVARPAALRWGTTWREEIGRYVLHGLLHLSGYDDRSPATRRAMKREEDRLVRALVRTGRPNPTRRTGHRP